MYVLSNALSCTSKSQATRPVDKAQGHSNFVVRRTFEAMTYRRSPHSREMNHRYGHRCLSPLEVARLSDACLNSQCVPSRPGTLVV